MHVFICMCVYLRSTNTGNIGSYLTDTGSVYITRDGGLTWEQVRMYNKCNIIFTQKLLMLDASLLG